MATGETRAGSSMVTATASDGYGGTNVYNVALTVVDVAGLREGTEGADTLAAQASADGYLGFGGNDRITGAARFVVGGVRDTITGWLAGEIALAADELVAGNALVEMGTFLAILLGTGLAGRPVALVAPPLSPTHRPLFRRPVRPSAA